MVSLVSGDVNKNGIDDLAATWGYYYGPNRTLVPQQWLCSELKVRVC